MQKLHRKAERQRREEMDRQQREHLRKEKERMRAEREERLRQFKLEDERRKEENRFLKAEKKILAQQRRGRGEFSINKRESSALRPVIRKAEVADRLVVKLVIPKNEEYQYTCANAICNLTRVVKGTKPRAGWDCADGGYVCRRRYKCKSCPRSFCKEGDSDDEYECKDVGKECMRVYTCKSCLCRFFTDHDLPEEEVLCRECIFRRWCRNQVKKNREN